MEKIVLVNKQNEYVQKIDTVNEQLILTTNLKDAFNYRVRPGGGVWDAENEKEYIIHYFENDFKDRVTSLHVKEIYDEY